MRLGDSTLSIVRQLIVRGLEDEVVRRLKARAATHGRSAEEEHREILRAALLRRRPRSLKDQLRAMPDAGKDRDFERVPDRGRRVHL